MPRVPWTLVAACAALAGALVSAAQRPGAFGESRNHPAIAYGTAPVSTAVAALNEKLADGSATLAFDPQTGYLPAVLAALEVPVESQVLVYSETSFQARKINQKNPRAIYFNDTVAVAWIRGADLLEVSAQDPRQGTIYYSLAQTPVGRPRFGRQEHCLSCHLSWETLAVPGPFVLTTHPRKSDRDYANGGVVDHRTDLSERWSGWYVSGARVPARHMGNVELIQPTPRIGPPPRLASVRDQFDTTGYLRDTSDIVALMVLEHQTHATNLITRLNWEARLGDPMRVREAVDDLVDYFLFVDEAAIAELIEGNSGFADVFSARGPRDSQGRSLRDLRLDGRMMRYPLSYMIYTPMFDALPADVRHAVYERLGAVLAGKDTRPRFKHLGTADRQAVLEILRDTKAGLPSSLR
jgi:hypothetical protein